MHECIIYASDSDITWQDEEDRCLASDMNIHQIIGCIVIMQSMSTSAQEAEATFLSSIQALVDPEDEEVED